MDVWQVYLIRNCHNALYCGISNNVDRRFQLHQTGKGAKALRGKGPLLLVWRSDPALELTKSQALKVEAQIKKLPKIQKERIVTKQCLPVRITID
ncbi:GIY-YIG nuclease family protein [Vibrio sp.]|nr:GIY-YIG nuclease family protein [Vibrio sp.]